MPKRFKRGRKYRRRTRRTRKRKSRSKFTSKVPRSIKGFKQLSFPAILTARLRYCSTQTVVPTWDVANGRWVGRLEYRANGLNPPAFQPVLDDPRVPMGLPDYASIYTRYKVKSSKMHVRFFAAPLPVDFQQGAGSTLLPTGPAYITCRRRGSITPSPTMTEFSLTTCRENGFRFIRIDPNQLTSSQTLPAPTAVSSKFRGVQNGTSFTVGYQSKYAKSTPLQAQSVISPHHSVIDKNPTQDEVFQIVLLNPDENQRVVGSDVPVRFSTCAPTPVQCFVTIIYNVTFWRSPTLKPMDQTSDVILEASEAGAG